MADWLTAPFMMLDNDSIVMCTVRTDVKKFRDNPRFKYRVEVDWLYDASSNGMPPLEMESMIEEFDESLHAIFKTDPIAIMTGIYTGAGKRTMVFYTLSLHIFQRKFNEALAGLPQLPLQFDVFEDSRWEEYSEVISEIRKADEEI